MNSGPLRSLAIILTRRCDLRCSYCYQERRPPWDMPWSVLRRALDHALAAARGRLELIFTGGEPLLAWPLLRRAVERVEERRPADLRVRYRVLSNGLAAGPAVRRWLAAHGLDLRLSCDGVPAAQELRGPGTSARLDRLLRALRREQPAWFRRHLAVALTVTPATVPHLADSVAHLLDLGVGNLGLAPAEPPPPGWRGDLLPELDRQFARIEALSLDHWRRTGEIPLLHLRGEGPDPAPPEPDRPVCGALDPAGLALDVDGRVHACSRAPFTPRRGAGAGRRAQLAALELGPLGDPGLEMRRRALAARPPVLAAFLAGRARRSPLGDCADCPERATCLVCPLSLDPMPEAAGPLRIPAFVCAFHRAVGRWRRRFPPRDRAWRMLQDPDLVRRYARRFRGISAL